MIVVVVTVSVEVCAFVRGWDPMFCCLPKITVDVISEMEVIVGLVAFFKSNINHTKF